MAALQRLVQVGGLGVEDVEGLIEVAVCRGLRDPETVAGQRDGSALTEPHEHQDRLLLAGQRPGPGAGSAALAFGGE